MNILNPESVRKLSHNNYCSKCC